LTETVVTAATGTQIYVLDIVTPEDFAVANADLLGTILGSFAIT
jgi:hypothetical protein